MFELEVLLREGVVCFFALGKPLLQNNNLLLEISVFQVKFLLSHAPVLLVAADSLLEQLILLINFNKQLISF